MAGSRSGDGSGSAPDLREGTPDVPCPECAARKSFDDFLADFTITTDERRDLVHFLAAYRYRKTVEALLPSKT